ncbi:putative monooxygenase [Purpureocillium lavendulum]|uniref:Monooxygenase n=1 Tax=Purpureocillium lavendulum TaxID=1247861 RepID=A0AB34FVT5_9HYPO|nr:putative monooxygenase [Purpureocillium lavendulum]
MTPPIAIVGAGPSGLTLGRLLQAANIDYVIFDRDELAATPATGHGGTLDIHADSGQVALQEAGLLDQFKAIARHDVPVTIADANGKVYVSGGEEEQDSSTKRPEIDRRDLRTLLLGSIPADKVRWGFRVQQVRQEANELMSVRFSNGRTESGFRLVVGADGAWSKTRNLVTSAEPQYSGIHFLTTAIQAGDLIYSSAVSLAGKGMYMALGDERQITVVQLGDGSYQVGIGLRLPESWSSENAALLKDPQALHMIRFSNGGFRDWPLYAMPTEALSWQPSPGVTLIGDAAHLTTPLVGEGVNCAMYDSLQLARQIIRHGLDDLGSAVSEHNIAISLVPLASHTLPAGDIETSDQERLRWLYWFDADTIIVNYNVPLEIFLPPDDIAFNDAILLASDDWNGFNNGVLALRTAMDLVLQQPRFTKHFIKVPQRWFNAYTNGLSLPEDSEYRPGDFLIHFAGVDIIGNGTRNRRMEECIAFLTASQIQSLMIVNDSSYTFQRWQGTLLIIAVSFFAIIFNTYLARRLPLVEGIILILHISTVFTNFNNGGDWDNKGLAVLVGMLSPVFAFIGPDSATHMSEEIRDASITLPRAMMWTIIINGLLGFAMLVTFCFCLGDVGTILSNPNVMPFVQSFLIATKSPAGTSAMTGITIILTTCGCITNVATASRQMFAFAGDSGLPFSRFLARVHPKLGIPLNAVILSFAISILLSLINIGSTVAFNAIASLGTAALISSYIISIICIALKRYRAEKLPSAHSMNWNVLIFGRKQYVGPIVYVREDF